MARMLCIAVQLGGCASGVGVSAAEWCWCG